MSITKSTIVVYEYSGSTNELTVPFDYLKRDFVVVALGGDGKPQKALKLGTDYRFATKTTIIITRQYQPEEGYNKVIIRRVTDASKRIINYQDGSILNASELNTSQLQALHVAEEARDLANYTLFVDDNNNLDARGRKIINLGDPTNPQDAVTKKYVDTASESVINSRDRAEAAAVKAEGYRDETLNAKEHVDAVGAYLEAKLEKADALNTSATKNATDAIEASNKATQAATEAEESNKEAQKAKEAAAQSAIEAKGYSDKINPHKLIQNVKDIATLKTSVFEEGYTVFVQEYSTGIVDSCHYRVIEREEGLDGILLSNGLYANILHNGEVNVKWLGAKGDGVTDDSDSFLKALGYTCVYIPKGIYVVNKQLDVSRCSKFIGEGSSLVTIKVQGNVVDFIVRNPTVSTMFDEVSTISSPISVEGASNIQLSDASLLNKGDTCIIIDSSESSYSSFRPYYKKGEILEVASKELNNVKLKNPLYDVYKATPTVKVYKHKGTPFSIGGFTLETKLNKSEQSKGISINASIGVNIFDVKSNTWGSACIGVSNGCYNVNITKCDIDMSELPESGTNYCVVIGNSQDVVITDCILKSIRHCIAHGGGDSPYSIVVRNTITLNSTLKGVGTQSAFDSHGNCEFIKISNCFIQGGLSLGGNHSFVMNNTIVGYKQSSVFRGYERSGADFVITDNYIRNSNGVVNQPSILSIGASVGDFTEKTLKGGAVIVRNNRIFQSGINEVNNSSIVYIRNRGCLAEIDINISDNIIEFDKDAQDTISPKILISIVSGAIYRDLTVSNNKLYGAYVKISNAKSISVENNYSIGRLTPKNYGVSGESSYSISNGKNMIVRNNTIETTVAGGIFVAGSNTGEFVEISGNVVKAFNANEGTSSVYKSGIYIQNVELAVVSSNVISGNKGDYSLRCAGTVTTLKEGLNSYKQGDTVYNSPFKPIGVNSIIPLCINVTQGTQVPSYTPSYIGETYVDTQGKKSYIAVGLTSSDWKVLNA